MWAIFELLELRKNELGKFQTEGQAFGRRVEMVVDDILKQTDPVIYQLIKKNILEVLGILGSFGKPTWREKLIFEGFFRCFFRGRCWHRFLIVFRRLET